MCVLLCFTEFIAIPKQLFAIYIFWTLIIEKFSILGLGKESGSESENWCFGQILLTSFFLLKKHTQFQFLLYFHNYDIFESYSPPLPSLGSLLLLILFLLWIFPLLLSCLFCVERNAFNRGCFQKQGWALFIGAWAPYQWKRTLCQPILTTFCPWGEVGALRVPSYLGTGCWWA